MRALGLSPDDYDDEVVEVWPDAWRAFQLFCAVRTQWRIGAVGPTGLDYNVVYSKLDRLQLDPADYDELEHDVQAMEEAALGVMSEKD